MRSAALLRSMQTPLIHFLITPSLAFAADMNQVEIPIRQQRRGLSRDTLERSPITRGH